MPNTADVKAWKAQLVAQAEQQILKLTDSDRFKQYLNTLAKFHHYSARNWSPVNKIDNLNRDFFVLCHD